MKIILLLIAFFQLTSIQSQVSIVKDINLGSGSGVPNFYTNNRIKYHDKLIFAASFQLNSPNMKLWITDGSENQTYSIGEMKDPSEFYYFSNTDEVLFSAISDTDGRELFKTNGLLSGLILLENINSGINSSSPKGFVEWNNELYFNATLGTNKELFRTNGLVNGTYLVTDAGKNPEYLTVLNDKLIYAADRYSENELAIRASLGTEYIDIYQGNTNSSSPILLTKFNDKVYFSANDGINGRELWVTNGTLSGTYMVQNLFVGSTGSNPYDFTIYNNELYFTASTASTGRELYKLSTNEVIQNVKDINQGTGDSDPSYLFVFNNELYFSANDNLNGVELWKSSGNGSTTVLVKNISEFYDGNPRYFTEYNGKLYFNADDGINGKELWVTDGSSSGTVLVENINTSYGSNPMDLIVANNLLFFSADDGTTGIELWKYQDPNLSIAELDEHLLSMYPNPATDTFTVKSNQPITKIILYDIQGKIIKSFDGTFETYPIDELTSGLYFIYINSENGSTTKKLIKN